MATENKGIYFTELTLKNVRCFGEEAVLKLSNEKGGWTKWNVILGDNGTGKTTLLQCLAFFETIEILEEDQTKSWFSKFFGSNQKSFSKIQPKNNLIYLFNRFVPIHFKITSNLTTSDNIEKDEMHFFQPMSGDSNHNKAGSSIFKNELFSNIFILGYGANRRISFQILTEKELDTEISATLFDDDAKLINTEEWLYQMDYAAVFAENRDTESRNYTKHRRDLIFDLLLGILPDIEEIKFIPKEDPSNPRPVMRFKTPYGWVGIHNLSYGYKTMVAWIVDVAARMFKRYPDSLNPLEEPVIILVDEIDLHLHPKWQRQIFDFLEKRFPRAQFIVTAHSPLIVQSAPKNANIIVLKREKIGDEEVVRIDNEVQSVRNWRIDQILSSDLFDVGIRNPEIEKQMDERTALLKKKKLTKIEKERLDELNELSYSLPTANTLEDIEAMEIIRKAAHYLKNQQK